MKDEERTAKDVRRDTYLSSCQRSKRESSRDSILAMSSIFQEAQPDSTTQESPTVAEYPHGQVQYRSRHTSKRNGVVSSRVEKRKPTKRLRYGDTPEVPTPYKRMRAKLEVPWLVKNVVVHAGCSNGQSGPWNSMHAVGVDRPVRCMACMTSRRRRKVSPTGSPASSRCNAT